MATINATVKPLLSSRACLSTGHKEVIRFLEDFEMFFLIFDDLVTQ